MKAQFYQTYYDADLLVFLALIFCVLSFYF